MNPTAQHKQGGGRDGSDGVRLKTLFVFLLYVVAAIAAVAGITWVFFLRAQNDLSAVGAEKSPLLAERQLPPANQPRLQVMPQLDLEAQHKYEDALIDGGVTNLGGGRARIPVAEAIRIMAAKSDVYFPARDKAP